MRGKSSSLVLMPWGKHRGKSLSDVPGSYLFWVLEECDKVQWTLRSAIEEELASRLPQQVAYTPPPPLTSSGISRSTIIEWCRRASLACHPDRGGSVAAMKLVNELRSMAGQ